jgi:hypothetical protein
MARSRPGLARAGSPQAVRGGSVGVEMFDESLRSVIVLHEGLRPVGMPYDGP